MVLCSIFCPVKEKFISVICGNVLGTDLSVGKKQERLK